VNTKCSTDPRPTKTATNETGRAAPARTPTNNSWCKTWLVFSEELAISSTLNTMMPRTVSGKSKIDQPQYDNNDEQPDTELDKPHKEMKSRPSLVVNSPLRAPQSLS
jgi:hypothetical protein